MYKLSTLLSGMALGLAALTNAVAADPAYPEKTVKIVVPFSPGGQFDTVARLLAKFATDSLKQTVMVENITGGGGNIGAARVSNSAPDGYTLLMLGGNHTISKSLYAKPGYDVVTAFSPISMVSISPHVILASTALPVTSFAQLKEYSKRNPNQLNYGTPGMGSSMHLVFEMIKANFGLEATHVPYRGGAQALTDLSANQIQLGVVAVGPAMDLIKNGRAKPLAVTSKARSKVLPDVPAFSEIGFPGLDTGSWMGLVGPKDMPPAIVNRWNTLIHTFLEDPEVSEKLDNLGFQKEPTTPAEFQKVIESEVEVYSKIVQKNNITIN